jgi:primosomal replication protein N
VDIPQDLILLERAVEEQRARLAGLDGEEFDAQHRAWQEAAQAAQAAIADHATVSGRSTEAVERAVKRAVRQTEEDPAE